MRQKKKTKTENKKNKRKKPLIKNIKLNKMAVM